MKTMVSVEKDEWLEFRAESIKEGSNASEIVRMLVSQFLQARKKYKQGTLDAVIMDTGFVYLPSLTDKPTVEKLSKMSDEEKKKALRQGYLWMKEAEAALRKVGYSQVEIKKITAGEEI